MLLLTAFKNELLQVRSFEALTPLLNTHLKSLGYLQSYLVLYGKNDSSLITGFNQTEIVNSIEFSSALLLPEEIEEKLPAGLYVVEPLFVDQEELGYIILHTQNHKAMEIEDVVAAISSAIKGIRLLEEANLAKAKAEKAEQSSSLFFANISEGLKEPIMAMKELLSDIDAKERKLYRAELKKAEQLLELSLSEHDQLEMDKKLYPLSTVLESFQKWKGEERLPSVFIDKDRFVQSVNIYLDSIRQLNLSYEIYEEIYSNEAKIVIKASSGWSPYSLSGSTAFLLSERIITLFSGTVEYLEDVIVIHIPYPLFDGENIKTESGQVLYIMGEDDEVPSCLDDVIAVSDSELIASFSIPQGIKAIALSCSISSKNRSVVLQLLNHAKVTATLPLLCFDLEEPAVNLTGALSLTEQRIDNAVCVVGDYPHILLGLNAFAKVLSFSSLDALLASDYLNSIGLIILQKTGYEYIKKARENIYLSQIPILILRPTFEESEIDEICDMPNIVICNTGASEADEFISRLVSIICGESILPPLTGALVKKAIAYLNKNARSQISRWQIAESVNISEDYLTRIFHKEIGISPTDYLNRYRIQLATEELRLTGSTINEVAFNTGFQDQAYFCRVFKKIKGFSPGSIRKKS